ncbi:MAG: hypothetical protein V9G12_01740 [Microthrixaceae bacterium]
MTTSQRCTRPRYRVTCVSIPSRTAAVKSAGFNVSFNQAGMPFPDGWPHTKV